MAESIQVQGEAPTGSTAPSAETTPPAEQTGNTQESAGGSENAPARPDYIPEKFWDGNLESSAKKMSASYSELEKKIGTPPAKETTSASDPNTSPDTTESTEEVKKELESRGLDFDSLSSKFSENGKLEDEDYTLLESKGIPRTYVDAFIAGQSALADSTRTELFAAAGGEDRYGDMIAWAKDNFNEEQIAAYNKTMESGDKNSAILAIRGLRASFEGKEGTGPGTRIEGDTPSVNSGERYNSRAEMIADMGSEQYKKDEAFRQRVAKKLQNSPNIL